MNRYEAYVYGVIDGEGRIVAVRTTSEHPIYMMTRDLSQGVCVLAHSYGDSYEEALENATIDYNRTPLSKRLHLEAR